jgi:hypothetical protein
MITFMDYPVYLDLQEMRDAEANYPIYLALQMMERQVMHDHHHKQPHLP